MFLYLNAGLHQWEGFKDAMSKPLILEVNSTRRTCYVWGTLSVTAGHSDTSVPSAELHINLTFHRCLWSNWPVHVLRLEL